MRKLDARPDMLIPLVSEQLNEGLIASHLGILYRGHTGVLTPPLVVNKDRFPFAFEDASDEGQYFILEGHHRAIAHCLYDNQVTVLELEDDSDLAKVKLRARRGELDPIRHTEQSIEAILAGFPFSHHPSYKYTLHEFIEEKVRRRFLNLANLPEYIQDALRMQLY